MSKKQSVEVTSEIGKKKTIVKILRFIPVKFLIGFSIIYTYIVNPIFIWMGII